MLILKPNMLIAYAYTGYNGMTFKVCRNKHTRIDCRLHVVSLCPLVVLVLADFILLFVRFVSIFVSFQNLTANKIKL